MTTAAALAAGLASCGGSSKSIGEIRGCLSDAGVPVRSAGISRQLSVPLSGNRAAQVGVEKSEPDAKHLSKTFKDVGAAAGKSGGVVVKGKVWVGYPGFVAKSLRTKIEDCAF